MKNYIALSCSADRQSLENLLALSSRLPVTGTIDEDSRVVLYFNHDDLTDEIFDEIAGWLPEDAVIERETIEEQNWNAQFEQTLEPVRVAEGLVITQSWNPVRSSGTIAEPGDLVITIDPKMSFGTGHHESTRLIASLLMKLDCSGKHVLDVGTGTGVLAILAALRGARRVIAFDNNEWAALNTRENVEQNGVGNLVDVRECELDDIIESGFDIILANLHLNLIVQLMPAMIRRFGNAERHLLTSGVLVEDYGWLIEQAERNLLRPVDERRENEWVATLWTP